MNVAIGDERLNNAKGIAGGGGNAAEIVPWLHISANAGEELRNYSDSPDEPDTVFAIVFKGYG